jgi:hypothetical protein
MAPVRELVATPWSLVALLVVEPVASIPSCGVKAVVGLVNLESQDHGHVPHPIVGGAICPSRWAIFE